MTDRESLLQEALRAKADAFDDVPMNGSLPETTALLRTAADEIERLQRVYVAASDLIDDPFGSLDLRKFYRLREAFYV